jgi:hypothetical protein
MLTTSIRILIAGVFSLATFSQALALRVTCEPGSEAVCEGFCTLESGGMSSNPDGSTTCTMMLKPTEKIKTNVKNANDKDWLVIQHRDKPAASTKP